MNWDIHKKRQARHTECQRRELWLVISRIREVRQTGRPVDVLAVVDEVLDQLDRPLYRDVNNRKDPPGFADWLDQEITRGG